jgi:membrane protein DedA with SNARE-associated domain
MQEWILLQEGWVVYLGLFSMLMGGAIGLPIPEDLPLILAGILLQIGQGELLPLFLVCYGSILLGDLLIFSIGRRFGPTLFSKPWFQKRLSPRKIKRIRLNIEKRSLPMIFIARHLFYLRTITFLTCGAVKMRVTQFLFADALAALISVPLMMTIGFYASEHYQEVLRNAEWVMTGLLLLLLGYGAYWYRKKHQPSLKQPTSEDGEV